MHAESGFHMLETGRKFEKRQWQRNFPKWSHLHFFFFFFDVGVFLLSSLINGPSFMSISSLVLELWQFFYKRLNRNPELETLPSEFCPISGDWGKLQISNLAQISLIKSYGILQNIRVTAFAVSELLREKNREMA